MLVSTLTSASKPSVLPRLHSSKSLSTKASSLGRASSRRPQQQTRGFRSVGKSPYYHRVNNTTSRDVEILNRTLMLRQQAGISISHMKVARIAGTGSCEKKSAVDLEKLKHDSNLAAVYLARTTITSYKSKGSNGQRSPQSYIAERNASRRIPRNIETKSVTSDDAAYAIPVKTFAGYRPQFEEFAPPTAPVPFPKDAGNILFNTPPPPPAPAGSALYVTDSELYLDGKSLEQELTPYYDPVKHNEPDGLPIIEECPIRKALEEYEAKPDLHYNGFGYNEPDGKPPAESSTVPDNGLSEYDQKMQADGYSRFEFNEPDGLPVEKPCVIEDALSEYDQKAEANGYQPFAHNEPNGQQPVVPDLVETALNEYDQKAEANDYKAFAHNEPNGQQPEVPDSVRTALNEYDQKWEPKIENDNFVFDEDFVSEVEKIASTAPTVPLKGAAPVPIRKIKTSSPQLLKPRRESAEEKKARRAKLDSDFDKSSSQFVRDIEAVRKSDKVRHSRKQLEEFEIEASVLLNQYHHLRGKIDARLEELDAEDGKAGGAAKSSVSTGGAAFSDTIESTANTHPFKSGIDVRREEEVFSGRPHKWQRRERRARRADKVKRVLGGAVAGAGIFYAAGVVSEFFTTGGSEGTGAVGL